MSPFGTGQNDNYQLGILNPVSQNNFRTNTTLTNIIQVVGGGTFSLYVNSTYAVFGVGSGSSGNKNI